MDNQFFERPILNSPYEYPTRYWELDDQGQPTQQIIENRRRAEFITPIPKPRKRKEKASQAELVFDEGKGLSTEKQQYDPTSAVINELRHHVDQWRSWPNPNDWKVTPDTQRLLQHWRHHKFSDAGPSFVRSKLWKPPSGDRALRLMACLISGIEDAGFTVSVEARRQEKQEQTVAKIHGQEIRFGLTEKVDRVEIAAPPKGGLLERGLTFGGKPVTFEPSGRLSIEVWTEWGSNRRGWKDGKSQRLKDQLSHIVAGFIRLALADRAEKEQRAAEERERQRIAEERARLEASIKTEQSKVNALRNTAARWSRAEQIRSFISAAREAAVQNGKSVEQGSPFGDWVIWAELQADRLDPLKESPASIIDQRARTEPVYTGY